MKSGLLFVQIITSIVLIICILMQSKGGGLGRTFAMTGSSFTRRGLEKVIFKLTFVSAALFALVSVLQLII